MTEEEINIIRTVMREEVGGLRSVMREEIGTAIAATERRMDERFAATERRTDERFAATERRTDERFASMSLQIATMDKRITGLSEQVTNLDEQIDGMDDQIGNIVRYLDTTIPPIIERLGRLENMVEPMSGHLVLFRASQRELQGTVRQVQIDQGQMLAILNGVIIRINEQENRLFDAITSVNKRIDLHENTPLDQTHPRPNSPHSAV